MDNYFDYTTGAVSSIGGRKDVGGTFGSNTSVTGTASHDESSLAFKGNLDYNWAASR